MLVFRQIIFVSSFFVCVNTIYVTDCFRYIWNTTSSSDGLDIHQNPDSDGLSPQRLQEDPADPIEEIDGQRIAFTRYHIIPPWLLKDVLTNAITSPQEEQRTEIIKFVIKLMDGMLGRPSGRQWLQPDVINGIKSLINPAQQRPGPVPDKLSLVIQELFVWQEYNLYWGPAPQHRSDESKAGFTLPEKDIVILAEETEAKTQFITLREYISSYLRKLTLEDLKRLLRHMELMLTTYPNIWKFSRNQWISEVDEERKYSLKGEPLTPSDDEWADSNRFKKGVLPSFRGNWLNLHPKSEHGHITSPDPICVGTFEALDKTLDGKKGSTYFCNPISKCLSTQSCETTIKDIVRIQYNHCSNVTVGHGRNMQYHHSTVKRELGNGSGVVCPAEIGLVVNETDVMDLTVEFGIRMFCMALHKNTVKGVYWAYLRQYPDQFKNYLVRLFKELPTWSNWASQFVQDKEYEEVAKYTYDYYPLFNQGRIDLLACELNYCYLRFCIDLATYGSNKFAGTFIGKTTPVPTGHYPVRKIH